MGIYIPNMEAKDFYEMCKKHNLEIIAATAAAVRPVVLCRDCKHRFNYPICSYRGDDWFCGYGEKREES